MREILEELREFGFVLIEGGSCGWLCWLRHASGHIELFGKGITFNEMVCAAGVSMNQRKQQRQKEADMVSGAAEFLKAKNSARPRCEGGRQQ